MEMSEFKQSIEKFVIDKKGNLGIFDEIENLNFEIMNENQDLFSYKIIINNRFKFIFKFLLNENVNLRKEFDILSNLPEEIGPYPYIYDDSKKYFPYVFEVISYERGKSLQKHFEMHLILFARKLAELHKIKTNQIQVQGKQTQTLNLWEYFIDNNEKYFTNTPEMMEDTYVKTILPHFQKLLQDVQPMFDQIKEFSLIHGNLSPKNVIFNNEYDVRLINWTQSHYCDNARDLVTFFYDGSWFNENRVKLELERQNILLDNYLKAYWSDPTFKQRVKIWMVYDMYSSLIFCRYKFHHFKDERESKVMYKKDLVAESNSLFEILKKKLNV